MEARSRGRALMCVATCHEAPRLMKAMRRACDRAADARWRAVSGGLSAAQGGRSGNAV
jgi:hypothetical protein